MYTIHTSCCSPCFLTSSLQLAPVTITPIRAAASGANFACVASYYNTAANESQPTLTADGMALLFGCNAWAVGQVVPASGGSAGRIVAVVHPNGTVDTRTRATNWMTGGNQRGFFRTVASTSLADGIYVGGTQGGGGVNDLRWVQYGAITNAATVGSPSSGIRAMLPALDVNGTMRLFFTQVGSSIGLNVFYSPGMPQPGALTSWGLVPGWPSAWLPTQYIPYAFAFENASFVWMTNDNPAPGTSYLMSMAWEASSGIWRQGPSVSIPATSSIRGLIGRNEGGQFILYATCRGGLWRYNTVTASLLRLATAAANTVYYGVAFTPYDPNLVPASSLPSATPTSTRSISTSATGSISVSSTASPTSTLSTGATTSATVTGEQQAWPVVL